MRARTANRTGIVIRRRVTPAGDILVHLLTPQGKLKAIARGGVRGPLASQLNLFHHVDVQVYQGPNNDLAAVKQAALQGALPQLAQPERHALAHLLAELADLLFQEGEHSDQAFDLFSGALRGLSRHEDAEWVAIVMAHKLLGLSGMIPQTARCARCREPDPGCPDPQGGHLLCRNCASHAPYPPESLHFLRSVLRQSVRESVEHPVPAEQRGALWRQLERFTDAQVGGVKSWSQVRRSAAQRADRAEKGDRGGLGAQDSRPQGDGARPAAE